MRIILAATTLVLTLLVSPLVGHEHHLGTNLEQCTGSFDGDADNDIYFTYFKLSCPISVPHRDYVESHCTGQLWSRSPLPERNGFHLVCDECSFSMMLKKRMKCRTFLIENINARFGFNGRSVFVEYPDESLSRK